MGKTKEQGGPAPQIKPTQPPNPPCRGRPPPPRTAGAHTPSQAPAPGAPPPQPASAAKPPGNPITHSHTDFDESLAPRQDEDRVLQRHETPERLAACQLRFPRLHLPGAHRTRHAAPVP